MKHGFDQLSGGGGVHSGIGYLLDLAPKDLEKVIYFAAYMITEVDTEARAEDMPTLEKKYSSDYKKVESRRDLELDTRTKSAISSVLTAQQLSELTSPVPAFP